MPKVVMQDDREVTRYDSLTSGECFQLVRGGPVFMKSDMVDDSGARWSFRLCDGETIELSDNVKVFPLDITEIELK